MRSGVQSAVKKTTPIAGARASLAVELACGHVLVRAASNVGTHAVCPDCTKARDVTKVKAPRGGDVRDALIAELRAQNDYLRALNGLTKNKAPGALAVVKPPPPPVAAPVAKVIPPKPPDDVTECRKCKRVGLISEDFGWLLVKGGGKWVPQPRCKTCVAAWSKAANAARWLKPAVVA